MLGRIGVFFVLVGVMIVFVSFASGKANSDSLTLFCIGTPLVLLGITLWFRNRERAPAERFKIFRKYASKKKSGESSPEPNKQ
jgi:hypothetical protein